MVHVVGAVYVCCEEICVLTSNFLHSFLTNVFGQSLQSDFFVLPVLSEVVNLSSIKMRLGCNELFMQFYLVALRRDYE